ncbi:extracellular solute-binding protein [Actinoalloteichus caeruleus]|uniref:extracellular solute-binding protein n=1 Tax=Actinoalloteichus cyanogriseus TaxID=2893586 RepID=UPI003BB97506
MRRDTLNTLGRTGVLGLGCVLAMTACGGSGGSDDQDGPVVFWDTSGPGESAVFRDLAEGCAASGGFEVAVEQVAFDQALNNFKNAAQGGQGPDVLRAEVAWVAQLAHNGLIQDLAGTGLDDQGDFLATPWSSTQFDGATYAVPQVTDTLALLYNREFLDEAGVEPPTSWEELLDIAPDLGGDSAFFVNNDGYYALPFIYSAGGDLLDVENQTIVVNSDEAVAGLGTARALLDEGAARTAQDPGNSYGNMKAAFASGEVAMIVDGPWAVADLLDGAAFQDPENLGVAPLPGPADGDGNGPVGGHDYVIRQGSERTDDAVSLIECMSGVEAQTTVAVELGLLPTRESVYEDPEVAEHPVVSAFSAAVERAHPRPWIAEGNELFDPLKIGYADVLAGNLSPAEAAEQVATAYQDTVVPDYTIG